MSVAAFIMVLYLLAVPLAVVRLERRWTWISRVSPMTVLYIIGLLVGNLIPIPESAVRVNTLVGNLAVPLAIPLMLMGCSLAQWSAKKALKTFLTGLFAVLAVSVAGFFLFRNAFGDSEQFAQVCAVATGMYTGGMPNVGAIKQGVGMSNELCLYLTSYDLIATGTYLLFVIFFGKRVFRFLLPAPDSTSVGEGVCDNSETQEKPIEKVTFRSAILVLSISAAIAAVGYILSLLASGDGSPNMTVLILSISTLAIAASFLPPFRSMKKTEAQTEKTEALRAQSFNFGLYFVYVFCLSIATSCNVRQMDLLGSLSILAYVFFIIFGSLVVQVLLARLFRLDSDTVLTASVALINSPPFVPMAAALLNNKEVVVTGIAEFKSQMQQS